MAEHPKPGPSAVPEMTLTEVRGFIEALAAHNPDPRTELTFADPFTLLVAVVLSAQATDASVNRATETLFRVAPTPKAMLQLGVEGVASHIRSIGLWQTKARNVIALAQALEDKCAGEVPATREALEALPGVGRKTANVVLNVVFGESTMAVDTHIFRLGNRTGLAPGKTPRAVEDGLVSRIPADLMHNAHHWLILHGRYVCKARRPECWRCVATRWCRYPEKILADPVASGPKQAIAVPGTPARAALTARASTPAGQASDDTPAKKPTRPKRLATGRPTGLSQVAAKTPAAGLAKREAPAEPEPAVRSRHVPKPERGAVRRPGAGRNGSRE